MKTPHEFTKSKAIKIDSIKKIKAAYSQAKKEGKVKYYQVYPISP